MHRPSSLTLAGVLLLLIGMSVPASADPPQKYMPEGPGVIDGRAAIVVLPALYDETGSPDFFDPVGLEVHLTPEDDPGVELAYPAGKWFQPPPGHYRVWLQGGWRMTPFAGRILWGAPVAKSGLSTVYTVGPAGRVKLPADLHGASDLELHLLHAGKYLESGFPRWEISPRRNAADVSEGVLMPAGRTVGALWNRKTRSYVALSRVFEVRERTTVEVPLEKPQDGADLLVELARHRVAGRAAELEVNLVVRHEGGERAPDLTILTADKVYGFWYGLPPGLAELKGESERDFLPSRQIQLRPGKIEHVNEALKPRPALEVQVDLPAILRQEKPAIEIRRLPLTEPLMHRDLAPAEASLRLEGLPPALLQVELQTNLGSFSREVDLGSGRDGFLLLKPELITLAGTVFYGDKGSPAKLTFANAKREVEARSEEDGRYRAVLLEPVQTVSIQLEGVHRTPYFDFFRPALAASEQIDFHLPDGDFRVKVLDAMTGKGIPKASVDLRNSYVARQDTATPEPGKQPEKAVFQIAKTDESGEARLPPLRAGKLELRVSAEGYAGMREPVKAEILDADADQMFEVRLQPVGETVPVRLILPDGAPASAAQVLLVDSLDVARDLFFARTDAEGKVGIPRKQRGFLLAKHSAAAFSIREWRPEGEERELEWLLPPASDRPLTVQVKDASGGPAGRADLAVWVEGWRLSGAVLAWLTAAPPVTDQNGYWTANNLPRGTVSILAWNSQGREARDGAALAARANSVSYPWPQPVQVEAVE